MTTKPQQAHEPLGPKIRRQRRRLGLTLDELAGRASISKPYLSLIETGRVANPPSDEKLRRLEQTLGFGSGELLTQAHLQRTPKDVRALLQKLLQRPENDPSTASPDLQTDLTAALVSGFFQELSDIPANRPQAAGSNSIPVINRVAAGYPRDFTDLSYPPRIAEEFVSCPEIQDRDAFAARVQDDSMAPKYGEGNIVIFSPAKLPRDGDDCFLRFADGHTTFSRIFFEPDNGRVAMLRLAPRNAQHVSKTVPAKSVTGMYRAVYQYQRVDGEI